MTTAFLPLALATFKPTGWPVTRIRAAPGFSEALPILIGGPLPATSLLSITGAVVVTTGEYTVSGPVRITPAVPTPADTAAPAPEARPSPATRPSLRHP